MAAETLQRAKSPYTRASELLLTLKLADTMTSPPLVSCVPQVAKRGAPPPPVAATFSAFGDEVGVMPPRKVAVVAPGELTVHPVGIAGAVTPSQFSDFNMPKRNP